jgi:hypothetical protein
VSIYYFKGIILGFADFFLDGNDGGQLGFSKAIENAQ